MKADLPLQLNPFLKVWPPIVIGSPLNVVS